jgi:hypothetical protein
MRVLKLVAVAAVTVRRPNGTLAKLRAAPHASGDAARPLPRLTRFGGSDLQRA